MERHKIKEDEAFTILTHASQRTNTKLRDVAAELVRTGRCPLSLTGLVAKDSRGCRQLACLTSQRGLKSRCEKLIFHRSRRW